MGISFFEIAFGDVVLNQEGETQVCCPFPHKAGDTEYFEINPSAGVNLAKGVFHCFTCGRAYSETSFAAEYLKVPYDTAAKFIRILHKSDHVSTWKYAEQGLDQSTPMKLLDQLQIPVHTAKELHLGYTGSGKAEVTIPIILFDQIVDSVTYRPGQRPKYIRRQNSMSGFPCPYDIWSQSPKDKATIICAGEKDMMIARANGFNAISFTGGENNLPKLFLEDFNERDVCIIYDNDETGRRGSKKLAYLLKQYAKSVRIADLSPICKEKGEDLWDFFCKYSKTRKDLIDIMNNATEVLEEDLVALKHEVYPTITLNQAMLPQNLNKVLKSNVQVIATIDAIYTAPTYITACKKNLDENSKNTMDVGEERSWYLDETNYKELFYMIDSNLKEKAIESYIKTDLLHIPSKEKGVVIRKESKIPVFKCVVTDTIESYTSNTSIEFMAFSLNKKLENGKKYEVTYKLVPHPQDGQKIIMVIKDVEESDDFLTSFKITPAVIESLNKFKVTTTVANKVNELVELTKGIVNADYNPILLKVVDIWFHSVLQFSVGRVRDIRGYIDGLIIGESRIGKSSTVAALQKMYGVGKIVSLAGTSATTAGLIGGSNKVSGGAYQTRAGVIPQNNKGAVIFEELVKCKADLIKELTDIRSSNKVRIARVNGSIELPAYVRMLTLTNSKTHDGVPRQINSYPNGIELLTDIIGTPEDIARYDMMAIFGFEATKKIDPFYTPPTPLPQIDYQNRIRWVWSRTQDQIYISKTVYQYAVQQANELNEEFGTYINIFGVEAWQKIMRIAIAIAGYVCSTDESYEQIIVEKEHIDEAVKLLRELYDNDTFKLREFVEEERKSNEVSNEDIDILESIWKLSSNLVEYLFKNQQTSQSNLSLVCGLDKEQFNRVIYKLTSNNLIKIDKTFIETTNKFAKAYKLIDRSVVIEREVVFKID